MHLAVSFFQKVASPELDLQRITVRAEYGAVAAEAGEAPATHIDIKVQGGKHLSEATVQRFGAGGTDLFCICHRVRNQPFAKSTETEVEVKRRDGHFCGHIKRGDLNLARCGNYRITIRRSAERENNCLQCCHLRLSHGDVRNWKRH